MKEFLNKYFPKYEALVELVKNRLEAGENIIAHAYGTSGLGRNLPSILVATDRRVLRYSKRLLREQLISCPYSAINLIDEQTSTTGGKQLSIHFLKGYISFSPSNLPKHKGKSEALVKEVYARIGKEKMQEKSTQTATPHLIELLEELNNLKQRGLITEEEFTAKKKEILSRI